ncbi:hypothetical protein ACTXT7_012750 [Hymenolepis weldensis]
MVKIECCQEDRERISSCEMNSECTVPFQASEVKAPNQEKGKDNNEAMGEKLQAVLINFWMAVHPKHDGKSPMELLMGRRNRLSILLSSEYSPEYRIGLRE